MFFFPDKYTSSRSRGISENKGLKEIQDYLITKVLRQRYHRTSIYVGQYWRYFWYKRPVIGDHYEQTSEKAPGLLDSKGVEPEIPQDISRWWPILQIFRFQQQCRNHCKADMSSISPSKWRINTQTRQGITL